jgi:RNA polymerase sigma-70 factor (ECF subfamily)
MTDADQPSPSIVGGFEAFVRAHQDMVFATAIRLLGNAAEAEDVAQDVFLKAFERFETLGSSPAAAGWLKTVARNACLTHLSRYRSRWRFFSELGSGREAEPGAAEDVRLATEGIQVRELEQADERERLERALRSLPDHQRVPIVLFHFEELSYEEIATTLGVSLAKVKTDIHRGREALRGHLLRLASRPAGQSEAPPLPLAPDGAPGTRHGSR